MKSGRIPIKLPFFVKNAVPVLKLMPQPMTSDSPNLCPYILPEAL